MTGIDQLRTLAGRIMSGEENDMPDEYGVPRPGNADDYQQFMLGLYDLISEASDLGARPDAIQALANARLMFLDEFEAKHPGHGQGRAVWR